MSDEYPQLMVSGSGDVSLGVSHENTEIAVTDILYTETIAWKKKISLNDPDGDTSGCFAFLADKTDSVWIDYDIDISGTITYHRWGNSNISLRLVTWDANEQSLQIIKEYDIPATGYTDITALVEWKEKGAFSIIRGQSCYLLFHYELDPVDIPYQFRADLDGTVTFRYNGRKKPVDVDIIRPETLLQRIVNNLTETQGIYGADIEDFNEDTDSLVMMSAAESIRGIEPGDESEGAKVHTSYNSFVEWMNVFGYEEHINNNSLMFKKRERGFRADLTAIELDESECADLKEYVNEDYLYSGVKVGYTRKEIENANVRFEFNGAHDYATDLVLEDKILELISPYRADCYGIEFLAHEREKTTTDNKADKDIFLVHVKEGDSTFETVKNTFSGNVLTNIQDGTVNDTLFNGFLNPLNLLKLNKGLIGVSVKNLRFTASDSNGEITIDGQNINADYDIPADAGLFEAIMYDIASRNIRQLPEGENANGIVRFAYKGETYGGFIEEISKNPAWETETVWKLYRKKG
jgi:hypothetical protein